MWGEHGGMGWWMLFGSIWFVVWGLIIWAIASVIRRDGSASNADSGSALDIARRRYARGEISREEFQQIQHDLSNQT